MKSQILFGKIKGKAGSEFRKKVLSSTRTKINFVRLIRIDEFASVG